MEDAPKCVSILRTFTDGEESKIELDEEALKSVFEKNEIADLPIMLLSVSGAFRKGKSFMLNFFLRYLRNTGHVSKDWLGQEPIGDGFPWRGGKAPHTQGIEIYDEAFFLQINGKKTAVLLMDTQGLFDSNSDKKICTQIFAFSTLLSSVQVFNLSHQIQENDLECLQCFTRYAEMAQSTNIFGEPPFQKLVFVVRDWQELEDHDFGLDVKAEEEGEPGYLDGVLSCLSENEELTAVRQQLKDSFSDIQCFLLPHPGLDVAVSHKAKPFHGDIADISEEFVEEVQVLADFLLNPSNGIQKTIYGRVITANSLVNYAIACSKAFAAGGIPEPQTMLKASSKVMNLHLMNSCIEEFKQLMKAVCCDYVTEDEFRTACRDAQHRVLEIFDENVTLGNNTSHAKVRANLLVLIRMQFEMFQSENEAKATEIQTTVRENGDTCVKQYAGMMNEATQNRLVPDEKFMEFHKRHKSEALNAFIRENRGKLGFESGLRIVEKDFVFALQVLRRQNNEKQAYAAVKTEGVERKLHKFVSECSEVYRSQMLKQIAKYAEDPIVKRKHEDFAGSAMTKFRTLCKGIPEKKVEKYEENLRLKIQKEFEDAKANMKTMKEILDMILKGKKAHMESVYLSMMSEDVADSYVLPEILEARHRHTLENLLEAMKSDEQLAEICWDAVYNPTVLKSVDELEAELNEKFQSITKNNEENRKIYMKTTTGFKRFFSKLFGSKKS